MLQVRRFDPDISDLPRWWYADDPVLTHAVNGLNLIFPDGERFFIRSVRHYESQVQDVGLRARMKSFYGQEGQHGRAHEVLIEALEQQGFEVRSWLDDYRRRAFKTIEPRFPPIMRLSVTVALEHFTASFARYALENRFLDAAHPGVRDLLFWHAAEEIEHKAVAFDVYEAVGGGWVVRVLGLLLATVVFVGFWQSAMNHLHAQEPAVDRAERRRLRRRARAQGQRRWSLLSSAFLDYVRPGFHPDQVDDQPLAVGYLTSIGRLHG